MTFRHTAILAAAVFLLLAAVWMFAPQLILSDWGVESSSPTDLLARRGAAFYLGIAVMFFLARNAAHSAIRTALIRGVITACSILALLGVYEFSAGHAQQGILIATLIEITLVLAFLYTGCTDKK